MPQDLSRRLHAVVRLRLVEGSWKAGTWSYGLDCALTVGSLFR